MNLEALKTALAASTQGTWGVRQMSERSVCNCMVDCDKGYGVIQGYSSPSMKQTYRDGWNEAEGNATFAALAHNAMPLLLEAVAVMKALGKAYDIGQEAASTSAIGRYRAILKEFP